MRGERENERGKKSSPSDIRHLVWSWLWIDMCRPPTNENGNKRKSNRKNNLGRSVVEKDSRDFLSFYLSETEESKKCSICCSSRHDTIIIYPYPPVPRQTRHFFSLLNSCVP